MFLLDMVAVLAVLAALVAMAFGYPFAGILTLICVLIVVSGVAAMRNI